ncbi:hypothetical protein [Arthrobacter sp. MYb213]|uniref:hypothetical protein n=1 Tax=Arthrobacter sp. MYb213 TaxID=1848595 RepID=UPI000CFD3A68|nr:hypothetical protein [Arthrobacter sp. MYb213]PRB71411.1 hypothetical protein CQ011_05785 [Arthrobacter sp. MYb213]
MANISDALNILENAGFEKLPKPLTVVGTEFDFEAAARGTGTSHDLVLIATDQVPIRRLQRLVAGLARSLDRVASRRPISLVLLGAVDAHERVALEHYARVLSVESQSPSVSEIHAAMAVLLPLKLPNADLVHGSDPVNEVMNTLGISKNSSDHIMFIKAAADGAAAVREKLRLYVNAGVEWHDDLETDNA